MTGGRSIKSRAVGGIICNGASSGGTGHGDGTA
jgi:hypothetical protein